MQAIRNYNLWTLIALYVAFAFFVSTTALFHFVSKKCFGNGTWGSPE